MVKRALCSALAVAILAQACLSSVVLADAVSSPGNGIDPGSPAATGLSPSAKSLSSTASALSGTAKADPMAPLPGPPSPIVRVPNNPVEDFFAVTLISLPFSAFWALVGTLIIGGAAQGHYPPDFNTQLLTTAGSIAAGTSLAIGLVSVQWGPSPHPTPSPTPLL